MEALLKRRKGSTTLKLRRVNGPQNASTIPARAAMVQPPLRHPPALFAARMTRLHFGRSLAPSQTKPSFGWRSRKTKRKERT